MTLTAPAVEALRTIYTTGSDADRERARTILADAGILPDPIGDRRERIRKGGPMLLGEELLPEVVYGARSALHDYVNAWHVAEANGLPGAREATAAPRGHGKTTAAVELGAIYHAGFCTRRFQVIVSDTYDQAKARIEAIKSAVETNDELRETFPRLRPAFGYGEPGEWRENNLVFACGCRIYAVGAGTSIRGLKHRDQRPTLLYLDDLEDEDSVATPYQIRKRLRWLTRVALALGSPIRGMSVLWVGTIIARDALLNLATGAALDKGQTRPAWANAWHAQVFRAELPGTPRLKVTATVTDEATGATFDVTREVGEPLWSELTREDLARIAGEVGDEAYAAEYMADPADRKGGMLVAPVEAVVLNPDDPPRLRVLRCPDGTVVPVSSMTIAAALDPQFAIEGESSDPDLAAVVVVGQMGARSFILDSWIGRDRDGQAGKVVSLAVAWGAYAAGVEKNGAQVLIADQARALAAVPVIGMQSTEGKEARALSASVRLQQGRVFVVSPQGHNRDLPAYLTAFPNGRYKDPVDAFVMALELATRAAPVEGGQGAAAR
jgi:predicted phage terminase large subunit-like protein